MFCWSRSSTTLEKLSVPRLLHSEKVTNPRMNSIPQIIFAKFVVVIDWQKLHDMRALLWLQGHYENILGHLERSIPVTLFAPLNNLDLFFQDIGCPSSAKQLLRIMGLSSHN